MKRFLSIIMSLILLLSYLIINPEVKASASSNLASGKIPTSSSSLTNGTRLTDGDKNTSMYTSPSYGGLQWVQLDLGSNCNINDIKLWHYYGDKRSYHDVIVQLSNDSNFSTGVTTVFNNDTDNSSHLGTGTDSEYIETSSGKDISFNSISARYVRLYTNGNTVNVYNHYVEVEVYGDSETTPSPPQVTYVNLAAGKLPSSSSSLTNGSRFTDGNKSTSAYTSPTYSGLQWLQLDLGSKCNINDIKLWHYYGDKRRYHDVIVQLSNDSAFSTGVTTVFNNDTDNSSRLGTGTDSEYTETTNGKDISFNTINARYVRFYTNGSTVNAYNHYVEAEVYGEPTETPDPTPVAKLIFTFDDGIIDHLTVAAPMLKAKGFKGTAYVCKNITIQSNSNNLNISDINSLYNDYGWDISNHTTSHYSLPTNKANNPAPTLEDLEVSYLDNQNWILSNGWRRGAYHVSYPFGDYNSELITYLKTIGVLTARQAWGGTQSMPVNNYYLLLSQSVNNSNVAVVKDQIDNAVSTGSTIFLTIHNIKDTTGSYIISPSNFQLIVDYVSNYVQQGKLKVTTVSEWYNSVK